MLPSFSYPVMTRVSILALLATVLVAAPVRHKGKTSRSSHSAVQSRYDARNSRFRSKFAVRHSPPAPTYQLHPDPERYQQIQQSLATRGYFKGEANGQWNDDSVDALKRFQADQKLDSDGKINALTLSGLGLGPRHDGTTAATVPLSAAAPSPTAVPEIVDPN